MLLTFETGYEVEDPAPDQIAEAFQEAHGRGGEFAILTDLQYGEEYYMQTAGDPESGYGLEYREGGEDQHYVTVDTRLSIDRVISAFQKYSAGDSSWKQDFQWEKMEFKKSGCLGMVVLLLAGAWASLQW